jgi:hypothetical protein
MISIHGLKIWSHFGRSPCMRQCDKNNCLGQVCPRRVVSRLKQGLDCPVPRFIVKRSDNQGVLGYFLSYERWSQGRDC